MRAAAGQLERRAGGDQPAVVDDVDPVGEPLGLVHVVRGQHDGHAVGAQLLEQLPGRTPGLRVHARRSARRRRPARAGRRSPSPGRAAAAGRRRAGGTACARSRRARAARRARRCRAGGRAARAMCRSISIARTPLQAPPSCSITPIRGSRSRAGRATGSSPSTRTVPCCGRAVALAGLERGGLAGAVGAEHRGDACRARRSGTRPSTATLSPYRITRPSTRDGRGGGGHAATV